MKDTPDGILVTEVSRPVRWGMVAVFLGFLFAVPVHQAAVEVAEGRRPGVLALFTAGRFPGRADLKRYEDSLTEQSRAARYCQPRLQEWLTGWGGFGSTNVVAGRDGWLFYRPGVDSVTGPGFLDPGTLHRRARNRREVMSEPVTPDPRPAILEFHRQVGAAGARLVVLPVPDKASVQPGELGSGGGPVPPPQNPSFAGLLADLRGAGVDVLDPSPALVRPGEVRYLAQDTHWTPEWMDEVARGLADGVRPHLPPGGGAAWRLEPVRVRGTGDLTEMLKLPEEQALFPPQEVTVARVLDGGGRPVRADAGSPVLLLGDSFTNIYSARPMGWGDGAGLAEHLAYHLGRPVDWIARNDAGAHATREMISSQRALGRDRLVGKRVVVWQFAARELALGDWRLVPIP